MEIFPSHSKSRHQRPLHRYLLPPNLFRRFPDRELPQRNMHDASQFTNYCLVLAMLDHLVRLSQKYRHPRNMFPSAPFTCFLRYVQTLLLNSSRQGANLSVSDWDIVGTPIKSTRPFLLQQAPYGLRHRLLYNLNRHECHPHLPHHSQTHLLPSQI